MSRVKAFFQKLFPKITTRSIPNSYLHNMVSPSVAKCGRCPYRATCNGTPTSDCDYAYEERNFPIHHHTH